MTSTTAVVVAAAHLAVGKKAAVPGSLSVPTQTTSITGENLTTGAYSQWRFWGPFTNQTGDYVQLGGDTSVLPLVGVGTPPTRSNVGGKVCPATFTSSANQATLLSDLSTGTLSSDTESPWIVTTTGDGIKVTFPASTTVKNGKIVLHWQSDNGPGKPVDVVFHLSDASAADVTKTITSVDFNPLFTEFGFSWNAAANGQTMSVTIKLNASSGAGNVGVLVAMWA